jgi:DinB family protein
MEFDLNQSYVVLERTPTVLRSMLAGLPDEWTKSNEGPETWSPFDVVGHLIDGERTDWIPRARLVLAESGATFEPFDRFAHLRTNSGRTLGDLLDTFAALRAVNLTILRGWDLTPDQLDLEAEHPELGRVTLRQLLATWVAHDLGHVGQIVRTMARQYTGEVGPWRAFLKVLQ